MMRFEVVEVRDLPSRKELLVSVRVQGGKTFLGAPLRDESTQLVWQLAGRQFPCGRSRNGARPPSCSAGRAPSRPHPAPTWWAESVT